jgi:hypothetical protein
MQKNTCTFDITALFMPLHEIVQVNGEKLS